MLRLASWIRPAGGSPAPVSAGAPGSRPQSRGEILAAERGVESLFGGSKRVGWDCSLVRSTVGEPSRSCHGEGHVRQSHSRIGCGGSLRGMETCTRARSDRGTRETLASLVSEDRAYKSKAKSSGGQRESDGVVVVQIGVQNNAPGAKDPDFDRACAGRERQGMPARLRRANHPGGRMSVEPSASEMAVWATCRGHALASPRCRLWVAAKRPQASSLCAKQSRWGDSPRAACRRRVLAGRVVASGRSSVSRVRENRTHGLTGESGNGLA